MKGRFLIALIATGVGATVAVTTGTLLEGAARAAESVVKAQRQVQSRGAAVPQPDTSSPNWKKLSDDVGVMIRDDERLGLRGRLYVSVEGVWLPVATDGLADVLPLVPVN